MELNLKLLCLNIGFSQKNKFIQKLSKSLKITKTDFYEKTLYPNKNILISPTSILYL
jgi:mannitol-specific phosphotransferase system IIBC component